MSMVTCCGASWWRIAWVLGALFSVPVVWPAVASVTRSEPLNGVTTEAFEAVGQLSHGGTTCSAVAVLDGQHVLTARHCVTTGGAVLGGVREPSAFTFEANGVTYQGVEVFADFGGDLALIRLDGVVSNAFDLWDSQTHGSESGLTFQGIGFGGTDADGDGQWGPGGEGVKRTFINTVDSIINGTIPGQGQVLRYDFDLSTSTNTGDLEGLHGPGDSGGAALIHDPFNSNALLLAGLMSSAGDPVNGATGSLVQVSNYHDAIISTVPEPTTALLLALAGIICSKHRRTPGRAACCEKC